MQGEDVIPDPDSFGNLRFRDHSVLQAGEIPDQGPIGVKDIEKGDFTTKTPNFVILNEVKDLSETRRSG